MRFAILRRNGRSVGKEFHIRGERLSTVRTLGELVRAHLVRQGIHDEFQVLHFRYAEQAANPIMAHPITDEWLAANGSNHNLVLTVWLAEDARPVQRPRRSWLASTAMDPLLDIEERETMREPQSSSLLPLWSRASAAIEPYSGSQSIVDQVNKAYGNMRHDVNRNMICTATCLGVALVCIAVLFVLAVCKSQQLSDLEGNHHALSANLKQNYATRDTMASLTDDIGNVRRSLESSIAAIHGDVVALHTEVASIKEEVNQKYATRENMASLANDVGNVRDTAESAIAAVSGDVIALHTKVASMKEEVNQKYATRENMASITNDVGSVRLTAESAIAAMGGVIFIKKPSTACPPGSEQCKVWRWVAPGNEAPYCHDSYQPAADGECVEEGGTWFGYIYGCCRL